MKMKYFLGSLLSLIFSISVIAQNNPGVEYLSLGEKKLAKEYFMKTMRQTPAESHYYLGEIAFSDGDFAEAKSQYEQGVAANPNGLSAIGLAKLLLKTNPKEAESQLSAIQKANKKDINVILAIAKAYLDNGMKDQALKKLEEARKVDKKSPYIYIFEGDMLAKENKPGEAAAQYDQAINFDPNCVLAYMKGAKVYEHINLKTATGLMKKALEIRPDYKIAYKDLAQLYYRDGFYPEAIAAYKEFISGGIYTSDDIKNYAAALYFSKDYEGAKNTLSEALQKDPNDFVLNRLMMYSTNELKDYEGGLAVAERFFNIPRTGQDTAKYIVQDYMSFGNILSETGNKAKAIEQYKKAIELDPAKIELNKEIATICANEGMDAEAANFYSKYIQLLGDKAEASDYFQLGRYYYVAGTNASKNPETKDLANDYFKLADKAFTTVTERIPDNYLGYLWRARANSSLDPDTSQGLAKPYYESAINAIIEKGGTNTRELIESYSYLSYYYYLQFEKSKKADDKANIKLYADKILELDPENSTGKQLSEFASAK